MGKPFAFLLSAFLGIQAFSKGWIIEVSETGLGAVVEINEGAYEEGTDLVFETKGREWGRGKFIRRLENNPRFGIIRVTDGHISPGIEMRPRVPFEEKDLVIASYREPRVFWIGLRLGPNFSRAWEKDTTGVFKFGYQIGVGALISMKKPDLGIDLIYSHRKTTNIVSNNSVTFEMKQLEIPAILWWRIHENADWTIRLGSGLGIKYGLGEYTVNVDGIGGTGPYRSDGFRPFQIDAIVAFGIDATFSWCKLVFDQRAFFGSNRSGAGGSTNIFGFDTNFGILF